MLLQAFSASGTVLSFNHTPYPVVCPGDRLVFTCVVTGSGGDIIWRRNNNQNPVFINYGEKPQPLDDFTLNTTSYNTTTSETVGTATSESVPVDLDGTISCSDDITKSFIALHINIEGMIYSLMLIWI